MSRLSENDRHRMERKLILQILIAHGMRPLPFFMLNEMLAMQGTELAYGEPERSIRALDFHLTYLSDYGLIERKSLREGRLDLEAQTVRALGKAVDLLDGRIAAIPGIA
jgi:hypothetical protein